MKKKLEHTLTLILVMMILPCALTFLLNGKMEEIYRSIQDEAAYISVKTSRGIQEMNLEEYIIGITATQIPLDYELEAVKAQMVIARTNLYRQMQDNEVWEGDYLSLTELELQGAAEKFIKAQKATKGQVLLYEDKLIMASFHALSGGKTRDGNETFLTEGYEYLQSKSCPADKKAQEYQSVIQIADSWKNLEIVKRDSAGYIQQLQLGDTLMSGEEFRNLLGLPSANFEIAVKEGKVYLTTCGIGHGLGLSQYTAQQLALVGKDYREILTYFYDGTEIQVYK